MKNKNYLVPMLPAMALLAGAWVSHFWNKDIKPWQKVTFAFFVFYFVIASRSGGHWEDMLKYMKYIPNDNPDLAVSPRPDKLFQLAFPKAMIAAIVSGVLIFLDTKIPKLKHITLTFVTIAIVFFAYDNGAKSVFKGDDLRDPELNRWAYVDKMVQEDNFKTLIYFGVPDQPDYWFYLNGINANVQAVKWQPEKNYIQHNPTATPNMEPLAKDPDALVVVQQFYLSEAGWNKERIAEVFQHYNRLDYNKHFAVYTAKKIKLSH